MWPCLAARLYHARAGLSPPSGTSPFRSIWAHRNWGRAETRNPKKARRWLEAAADNGSEEARQILRERF